MASSLIVATLLVISISKPYYQVNGLDYEPPVVLSPEMYAYLHPKPPQPNMSNQCESIDCYSLPLAANVQAVRGHESGSKGGKGLSASGIAGIPVGFIFGCLILLAIGYLVMKRQDNAQRAKAHQLPDV